MRLNELKFLRTVNDEQVDDIESLTKHSKTWGSLSGSLGCGCRAWRMLSLAGFQDIRLFQWLENAHPNIKEMKNMLATRATCPFWQVDLKPQARLKSHMLFSFEKTEHVVGYVQETCSD